MINCEGGGTQSAVHNHLETGREEGRNREEVKE